MAVDKELADEISSAAETVAAQMHDDKEPVADVEESKEEVQEDNSAEDNSAVDDQTNDGADAETGGDAGQEEERKEPAGISDAALSQAILAGIPVADARGFASDDSLLRVVETIRGAAEEQGSKDEELAEEDPFAGFPELDPEEYDEKVIATFDAMKGFLKTQHETIKAFKARQDEAVRSANENAARDVEKWYDSQVAGLGEDFVDVLGKESYSALAKGSPQLAKRDEIANKMAVMLSGYSASGQKSPPRDEVFRDAARLVLGDEFLKVHERKLSKDLQSRATKHISRVDSKRTKQNQTPFEAAASIVDRKYFGK